jgi:hypothetical protein
MSIFRFIYVDNALLDSSKLRFTMTCVDLDPFDFGMRILWSRLHARTEHKNHHSALSPVKSFPGPVYVPTEFELTSPGWRFTLPGFHMA